MKSRIISRRSFITAALMSSILIGQHSAAAESLPCGITQVTFSTTGGFHYPTISNDGTLVAYSADRNPTGQNADGNLELFLYNSVSGVTVQLTDTTGLGNFTPFISGDGTKIAYASQRNDLGGNPDGNVDVFMFDVQTSVITQVTAGAVHNTIEAIDYDGSMIALYTHNNYTGGNGDGNGEMFILDVPTGAYTQVTTSTGGGFLHGGGALSGDGLKLGFGSHVNLAGVDPDGKYDAFTYDIETSTLSQIGPIGEQSIPGDWDGDGSHYVFYANAYPSGNPELNFELFLFDAETGGIQMLTDTGAGIYNTQPTISADGNRISFISTNDWTGGNADGNPEVFIIDVNTGSVSLVTNTEGYEILYPELSGNGAKIVFSSNLFASLGNADGNYEIFFAECQQPAPPPSSDLAVSMSVDKINAKQGDKVTYTITLQNFGPDDAADVVVNDLISSSSTFVSANSNKGAFTTPAVGQSGSVTWNVGSLADGTQAAAQIQVTVILKGKGSITNTTTVTSSTGDPNAANNSAAITVNVGSGGGGGKK